MKILIINPNSDTGMTETILRSAQNFAGKRCQITCESTPGAPEFIDTYLDQAVAAPGMMQLVKNNETEVDGFIIACHCDPNLDLLKEISAKPVIGIGEASLKIASMLGHSYSIIATTKRSIPNKESLVSKYQLQSQLASIRVPTQFADALDSGDAYLAAAKRAIEEDGAEVIVLGCAGLSGLDKKLQQQIPAPVLDGVICAVFILEGMIRYRITTSKVGRFRG